MDGMMGLLRREPCVLALASVCGAEAFPEEAVAQVVRVVEKLLRAMRLAPPARVVNRLVRRCLRVDESGLWRVDAGALFGAGHRPEPLGVGVTVRTQWPLHHAAEFTAEELAVWRAKVAELRVVPQHAQRSPGWYAQRLGAVTASDYATAVGESAYDKPDDLLLKKCGRGPPFVGNKYTRHGQRFEDAAVKLYEKLYGVRVHEFGLMPHGAIPSHSSATLPIVAASPDGITDTGVMLEIKCPYTRRIVHYHPGEQGATDGDRTVVPHGYYCQMQQQLECCDLEVCDFMECAIKEYASSAAFYADASETQGHLNRAGKVRSCVLEYLRVDPQDPPQDQAANGQMHAVYPPDLYASGPDLQRWMRETMRSCEADPTLLFQGPVYYWVEDVAVFRVYRDRAFFAERLPRLRGFWDSVEAARADPSLLDDLQARRSSRARSRRAPGGARGSRRGAHPPGDAVLELCQGTCLIGSD